MRKLIDVPEIVAPDANYLKGSLKDKSTGILGTQVGKALFGDIIQTFSKLVSRAGISENSLADNETNGHQLLEAVQMVVGKVFSAYVLLNGTIQKSIFVEEYTITRTTTGVYQINELINELSLFERYRIEVQPINDVAVPTPLFATIYQPPSAVGVYVHLYDSTGVLTDGRFFLTISKFA